MASDEKKILLVEDEKAIRDAVAAYLEREGYIVRGVGDGQSAVEEFEKHSFDLALRDRFKIRSFGRSQNGPEPRFRTNCAGGGTLHTLSAAPMLGLSSRLRRLGRHYHASRPPQRRTVHPSAKNAVGLRPTCFFVCGLHCAPAPGRSDA